MRSRLDNRILISWLSYDNEFCSVTIRQGLWFEQFDINLYDKMNNIVMHDRLQTFIAIVSRSNSRGKPSSKPFIGCFRSNVCVLLGPSLFFFP